MNPDIHTLTGAYALDALPDDERRAFEQHLEVCDACTQEVAELRDVAAGLGAAAGEEPPPELRARVLAEIDQVRQEPPRPRPETTGTDVEAPGLLRRLALPAAAALVLIVVGLAAVIGSLNARVDELERASTRIVDVLAASDARTFTVEDGADGPSATVVFSPTRGEGVFLAAGMPELGEDQIYELWLIGDQGPVPAGLFGVDDAGRATHVVTGDLGRVQAVAVTAEPAGGSPQPTSDPLVVVPLGA